MSDYYEHRISDLEDSLTACEESLTKCEAENARMRRLIRAAIHDIDIDFPRSAVARLKDSLGELFDIR